MSTYHIYINETFKNHLITLKAKEREKIYEKFKYMSEGMWDGGLRVKKLKGVASGIVFEARLNRADRILFTMGKNYNGVGIYIWGISKHDDVMRYAKNIIPDNVPFLLCEHEESIDYEDVDFENFNTDFYTQEDIAEKAHHDYGPQRWHVLSEDEWRRILLYDGGTDFELSMYLSPEQNEVLKHDPPLLISGTAGSGKTTITTYYLLKNIRPDAKRIYITYSKRLRDFAATLYKGLTAYINTPDNITTEFMVLRELLLKIARTYGVHFDPLSEIDIDKFAMIISAYAPARKYDPELIWEEIRSIIKGAKPPLQTGWLKKFMERYRKKEVSSRELMSLADFLASISTFDISGKIINAIKRRTGFENISLFANALSNREWALSSNTAGALEDILAILQKKENDFSKPLLSFEEYRTLGSKRAPHFKHDRREIYTIAEYYQSKLDSEKLWDEIDLCKRVAGLLDTHPEEYRYDLVVCDEVQDFCDSELHILFRLSADHRNIVLTGDPRQIINPSGFRWEEVRRYFFERGISIPDVIKLSLNFRSVGSIIKLGNALLDLKQKLVGLSGGEMREDWKFNGRPPVVMTINNDRQLASAINLSRAGIVILARNTEEVMKLKTILNSELVFTVHEMKGLEFDTVILWKFCSDEKTYQIWKNIASGKLPDERHKAHITHEINLFYVAITRARNKIIIFDGASPSPIWSIESLAALIIFSSDTALVREYTAGTSGPLEWEKQGDYFFDRGHTSAALECYRNSGNLQKAELCQAILLEKSGKFLDAATKYEKLNQFNDAARCWEKGRAFNDAARVYEILGDKERKLHCLARAFEMGGDYESAVDIWLSTGNIHEAVNCMQKGKLYNRLGNYYAKSKKFHEAAEAFASGGDDINAAICYKKAKKYPKAAYHFEKAGDYHNAAAVYRKIGNRDMEIRCLLQLKNYYEAAILCEKNRDYQKALEYFILYAQTNNEAKERLRSEAETPSERKASLIKCAIRFQSIGEDEKAAKKYVAAGEYDAAANLYKKTGNYKQMGLCFQLKNDYLAAAQAYEMAGDQSSLAEATFYYSMFIKKNYREAQSVRHQLLTGADKILQNGDIDRALARYKALASDEKIIDVFSKIDRDDHALEFIIEMNDTDLLELLISKKPTFNPSDEAIIKHIKNISPIKNNASVLFKHTTTGGIIARIILHRQQTQKSESNNNLALKLHEILWENGKEYYFMDENTVKMMICFNIHQGLFEAIELFEKLKIRDQQIILKNIIDELNQYKEQDPYIHAIYLYFTDKKAFNIAVEKIPINDITAQLLSKSKSWLNVYDYFISKGDLGNAYDVAFSNEDFGKAATVAEKQKNYFIAGLNYKCVGDHEGTVRCLNNSGHHGLKELAKYYKSRKMYEEALKIFIQLNDEKSASSVKRLLEKEKAKREFYNQKGLFDDM